MAFLESSIYLQYFAYCLLMTHQFKSLAKEPDANFPCFELKNVPNSMAEAVKNNVSFEHLQFSLPSLKTVDAEVIRMPEGTTRWLSSVSFLNKRCT